MGRQRGDMARGQEPCACVSSRGLRCQALELSLALAEPEVEHALEDTPKGVSRICDRKNHSATCLEMSGRVSWNGGRPAVSAPSSEERGSTHHSRCARLGSVSHPCEQLTTRVLV
eukprot:4154182-Prymnesium_polylepis.2